MATYPKVDLRCGQRIRAGRLANLLAIDPAALSLAFVDTLVPNSLSQSSSNLVWCPRCAQVGYHSAAFQLNHVRACPIHRVPLRRACAKCKQPLPYALFGAKPLVFFICPHCREEFGPGAAYLQGKLAPERTRS